MKGRPFTLVSLVVIVGLLATFMPTSFISLPVGGQAANPKAAPLESALGLAPQVVEASSGSLSWAARANMPTERAYLGVALADNGKIYAIGGQNNAGILATVEEYDPATDTWRTRTSMPTARRHVGVAASSGKVYAIGGESGTEFTKVEEYDPVTDTWTARRSMPTPRHAFGLVTADNGKIYAIGGYSHLVGGFLAVVEEYDPRTDTWTTRTSMPTARQALGVAAGNGKIYAIGGASNRDLNVVEEYDPESDRWTTRTSMPSARGALGVVTAADGLIYAIGGHNPNLGGMLSTVEEYDPKTDSWAKRTSMLTARWYLGTTAADNGRIYAVGGISYTGGWLNVVEEATIGTAPPSVLPPQRQASSEGLSRLFDLGSFTNPGQDGPWVAEVDWGDGSLPDKFDILVAGPLGTRFHTYADNGDYTVRVTVTDKDGESGSGSFLARVENVPPEVDAGSEATINEGQTFSGSGSFTDLGADTWTAIVDYEDGSGVQPLPLNPDKTFSLSHTCADNGLYTVTVTVTDDDGGAGSDIVVVTVRNVAPEVGAITAPVDPVAVDTPISTSAPFTDPGRLDTHSAVWDWGDGGTSAGTVTETNAPGSVTGTHTYTTAGVYTLRLTVTDKDNESGESIFEYVVVYDSSAGFVTGGGWINSPPGAYPSNPALTGKATFGFVSKYEKGATVPTGNTEFQFKVANLNFHSTSYQWLIVSGPKAQFKGSGTINGAGDYGFMLTATDGHINGGGVDKFRIKIWDRATGEIVYDNQMGDSDTADATTAIQGGSIVIHKG
ncbi:MAG: PKD domain-containing protein [Chloroflexi bacterium]|nr:PKD domain-containing protein [Chloroflexota bacterium]